MTGCNYFKDFKGLSDSSKQSVLPLDTAKSMTKSVFHNTEFEKNTFTYPLDSTVLIGDYHQNRSFKLREIVAQEKDTLHRDDLRALELDFDEIIVGRGTNQHNISFRSSKKTLAYKYSKDILLILKLQKIKEKSVSIKQTFLGEPELSYNLKYTYFY